MGYARGRMEPSWVGRWVRAGMIGWVVRGVARVGNSGSLQGPDAHV
jgi:hypothetical protein